MLIKTEGIVIRTRDYGESHKVVVLFTANGEAARPGPGAKKPRSRLGAVTQLFTRGQYLCFLGSGMGTLSQGELISSHHGLRSDLLLTATAAYLVELLDRMTEEKDPSPALYRLLSSTLDQLGEGGPIRRSFHGSSSLKYWRPRDTGPCWTSAPFAAQETVPLLQRPAGRFFVLRLPPPGSAHPSFVGDGRPPSAALAAHYPGSDRGSAG